MKPSNITLLRGAAFALLALGLASCDPAIGPSALSQLPAPGLTLRVEEYLLNRYGARMEPPADTTYITASANTDAFAGAPGVSRMILRRDTSTTSMGDTMFVQYLTNGDIALYQTLPRFGPFSARGTWVIFPIGTKGTTVRVVADSSYLNRSDTLEHYNETWTSSFHGPEFVGALTTMKAMIVQKFASSIGVNRRDTVTQTHTMWYSPKLGTIVRWESLQVSTRDPGGSGFAGRGFVLLDHRQR